MIINKSIVILGKGDVGITAAIGINSGHGKIMFDQLEEPKEIGSQLPLGTTDDYLHPVELVFENEKSIDVLIKALKTCKKDMINFKKRERCEDV